MKELTDEMSRQAMANLKDAAAAAVKPGGAAGPTTVAQVTPANWTWAGEGGGPATEVTAGSPAPWARLAMGRVCGTRPAAFGVMQRWAPC